MKTYLKALFLLVSLQAGVLTTPVHADQPQEPPPPPGGGHGSGSNQPPAGAPIDGGLGILVLLGTAFGCGKIFRQGNGGNKKGTDGSQSSGNNDL